MSTDLVPEVSEAPAFHFVMNNFRLILPMATDRILRVLGLSATTCVLDLHPSWLLKSCSEKVLERLVTIANPSLIKGALFEPLKEAVISPLLKKTSLARDEVASYSYGLASNLPFLGKDRVAEQLQGFLGHTI